MNDSMPLRLAIFGCRSAARNVAAWHERLKDAVIVAVADTTPGLARPIAEQTNASIVAEGLNELLSAHGNHFDAVVMDAAEVDVATVARTGKHVLVHSPPRVSLEEIEAWIDACRRGGVRLMVGGEERFSPAHQAVWDALDRGQLGQPGLLRIHRWTPHDDASPFFSRMFAGLDLSNWLFGSMPTSVYAVSRCVSSSGIDYAQIHLGYPHDAMALIDVTTALPTGDAYDSLSLIGSTGAAYADDEHNMQLVYRGGPPQARITEGAGLDRLAQLQEFVDAVRQERDPVPGGDDAHRAVLVAAAVDRCLDSGRAARLEGGRYELV